MSGPPADIADYIAARPEPVQAILRQLRETILAAVPGAGEKISYKIPAVTLGGRVLMHYAAWKSHVSLYPLPPADEDLRRDLEPYLAGPGTVKFPLAGPIPHDLVRRIAAAHARQAQPGGG